MGCVGQSRELGTWDERSVENSSLFPSIPHPLSFPFTITSSVIYTMLSRAVRPAVNAAAHIQAPAQRNMATLREIEMRLKSVRNIEKITKVSPYHVCGYAYLQC